MEMIMKKIATSALLALSILGGIANAASASKAYSLQDSSTPDRIFLLSFHLE